MKPARYRSASQNADRSARFDVLRRQALRILAAAMTVGISILVALWWTTTTLTSSHLALMAKDKAPDFVLRDQDGRVHALHDYQGRPVAIAFLPDTGKESQLQLRSLTANIRQFDTLGVKVFAIVAAGAAELKRLHDQLHLEYPLLTDPGNTVAASYGVAGRPRLDQRVSYVIGRDGRVILPITTVNISEHGRQLAELTECCLDSRPSAPSKQIGKPLADFRLPSVADGKLVSLYGDHSQSVTVLVITSAECPCSAKYEGRIADLSVSYGRKHVRFVAMNSSSGEEPGTIAEHAAKAGFTFPVLKDQGNVIADKIGAEVTPEVFVMDANGIVRYHGRIDDSRDPAQVVNHDLRNALDFLLAGKNPTHAEAYSFGCAILRAPRATDDKSH